MKRTKNFLKLFVLSMSFSFLYTFSQAQVININNAADAESLFSVEELIRNVLINGNCAEVSNIKTNIVGVPNQNPSDRGVKSYGYFRTPTGIDFPFREGMVLTTGRAASGGNNATTGSLSDVIGTGSDPDLVDATGNTAFPYNDALFVEFTFVPTSDEISFP